jgi:hypothetical protein
MPTRISERHAVLGIDPGRTTGVAACHFETEATLKETLLNAEEKKAIEVTGDWMEQACKIAGIIKRFVYRAHIEKEIPFDNIHIAIEDFVLRRRREGGATGDLTSIWVAAGAIALYRGHALGQGPMMHTVDYETWDDADRFTWRQASQAKSFATNARLKLWGLYEPGSEHCKDAWRHVALEVNTVLP